MRRIEYKFLHWGPFVTHYNMLPEELKSLSALQDGQGFQSGLAGHLKDEYELDSNVVSNIINPYVQSYLLGLYDYRQVKLSNKYKLVNSWVNYQRKYEFNPPHTHDDDLSFVIYLSVPDGLEEECKTSVSNSPGPGCIVFDFNMPSADSYNKLFLQTHAHLPKPGDMFIFPAQLPHWVYPFKATEGERVSVSGNIRLINEKKE